MSTIILFPPEDHVRLWGVLAHVGAAERERIMSLPVQQRQAQIDRIEKEVSRLRRKGARR